MGEPPETGVKRAERCIQHQAYRLAPGKASPEIGARAVMAACARDVAQAAEDAWRASFNAHDEGGHPPGLQVAAAEGPGCEVGGKPCPPGSYDIARVKQTAQDRYDRVKQDLSEQALFRVVEAGAGKCDPLPPGAMKN